MPRTYAKRTREHYAVVHAAVYAPLPLETTERPTSAESEIVSSSPPSGPPPQRVMTSLSAHAIAEAILVRLRCQLQQLGGLRYGAENSVQLVDASWEGPTDTAVTIPSMPSPLPPQKKTKCAVTTKEKGSETAVGEGEGPVRDTKVTGASTTATPSSSVKQSEAKVSHSDEEVPDASGGRALKMVLQLNAPRDAAVLHLFRAACATMHMVAIPTATAAREGHEGSARGRQRRTLPSMVMGTVALRVIRC